MVDRYRKLMWGALLHDIGKLVQRAGIHQGKHSYQGSKYIKELINEDDIISCIANHHINEIRDANLQSESLAYIVYEADNIAAGVDRRASNDSDTGGFNSSMPLKSIFNLFRYDKSSSETSYPMVTLNDDEKINFPIQNENIEVSAQKYEYIFNDFDKSLKSMNYKTDSIESLLKLIEKTLCYVPSSTSTSEVADISLFNHSKVTAMLSGCMYYYFNENNITDYKEAIFNENFRNEETYMVVSGELSGIQNFIYTISSKGALKTLRGRSFYLEFFTEHVIDEILSECELSRVNLLYSGGGHFYMIMPNTQKVKNALNRAKELVNEWLLEQYSTELYFELSYIEASANTIGNELDKKIKESNLLGELFRITGAKNSKGKLMRYSKEQLKQITTPNPLKDYSTECSICRTSSVSTKEFRGNKTCESCKGMYELGDMLPRLNEKDVIIIGEEIEDIALSLPSFNNDKYLSVSDRDSAIKLLEEGKNIRIYSINQALTGDKYVNEIWAGTYIASDNKKSLIDFETLANKSRGIKRIGVLRADVDNLGKGFVSGFESDDFSNRYQYITLSRNADLSYKLSMFFKHEINKICSGDIGFEQFKLIKGDTGNKRRNVVIVYSGGDDLFIVGAWNEIIELAVDINTAFREFTNSKMTISAGISLFRHDFPINQMASITGELEDIAKNTGKNKVVLFGKESNERNTDNLSKYEHTYSWDDFTDNVVGDKLNKLSDWFNFDESKRSRNKLNMGSSMLYKLLNLLRQTKQEMNDKKERINLARIAYTLARLEPEKDSNKMSLYRDFKNCFYSWAMNEKDILETITALNIIVYLNRKEG